MSLASQVVALAQRIGQEIKAVRSELSNSLTTKISSFADPNADRIVFWDDSASAYVPLTASTGLTISGTTMTVRTGNETQTGIVELATAAETIAGVDAVRAVHPAGLKAAEAGVATLVDAATIALAVNNAKLYRVTIAGDRTIGVPTGAIDGQRILIAVTASGADRILTLTTDVGNAFKFGTDITVIPTIIAGSTTYIGCVFSVAAQRWHVLAVSGGY